MNVKGSDPIMAGKEVATTSNLQKHATVVWYNLHLEFHQQEI